MDRSEKRIQNNKLRRKRERRRNILLTVLASFLVIALSFTINGFLSNAKTESEGVEFKYYKSVFVEKGDTLWDIANEYMSSDQKNTAEYVKEIIEVNGLHNEQITAGSYLIVPYFSSDYIG